MGYLMKILATRELRDSGFLELDILQSCLNSGSDAH